MTSGEVVEFLQRCSGGELSDILRRVFAARTEAEDEGTAFLHRLVLGMASRENLSADAAGVEWGPWTIAAVAYAAPGEYPDDFAGEPFVQYGDCPTCRVKVCSHVKRAVCPLCGQPVYLT